MADKQIKVSELNIHPVDTDSPTPLYHQIEKDLRRLLEDGQLSPEDMLPPELELAKAYGVGRHTMREALARLVADDLITRRAGHGTIVKASYDLTKFYLDRSFTRQMAAMGRTARSRVMDVQSGVISAVHPEVLQSRRGEPFLLLQRLRLGDDTPIGLQTAIILTERCKGIESINFGKESFYAVLAEHYNIVITKITHTVNAIIANELQAELLQIETGAALLLVYTVAYINDDEIIEHTESIYRADLYEYSTTARI